MLSYLAQINWARLWRRAVWTFFFGCFLALVVLMADDMKNNQPVVFGIVILAAVVTAVAFVYARTSKEALLIAICGLCTHVFLEASYWSSAIEDISAHVEREKVAADARRIVAEKRTERYASSASGKSVARLEAEIKAAEQSDRWTSTKGCTDATIPESMAFCKSYYLLTAELGDAREAQNLEGVVWQTGTNIEVGDIPRNLAKGAMFIASLTGISVEEATNLLVIALVLFMQAGLAGSLRVGYAPEKTPPPVPSGKLQEAHKASPVSVAIHAPRRPAGLPDVIEKAQAKPQLEAPLPPEPETPPDGDGTPAETPAESLQKAAESRQEPNTVVNFPKPLSKREKAKQKKQRVEQENRALVESFVVDRLDTEHPRAQIELTPKGGHKSGGTDSDDIYQDYRRYCKSRGVVGVNRSHLGRFIGEFVDRAKGSKGAVYGAVIRTEAKRKVA